jgi:hypothetical protein
MRRASERREAPTRSRLVGGLGSATVVVPDGSPAVLTVEGVDDRHVPAVRAGYTFDPLATRTTNVFTVPSGDVADGIVAELFGDGDAVTLATAARSLAAANGTLGEAGSEPLRVDRDRLRRVVAARVVVARERARESLRRGTDLPASDRRTAVRRATRTWQGTGARALAVTNGSFAAAVAEEASALGATRGSDAPGRAALRTRLDAALSAPSFRERVTVPESVARPVGSAVRRHAEETVHRAVESKLRDGSATVVRNASEVVVSNATEAALGAVPAGLPVAPVPGYWYATANVWDVEVRGQYARFTVRARTGDPTDPDATVAYTRDAGAVRLDVDEDGTPERLGRNRPVAFDQRTAVVVVVPPGGRGVGDVDGDADERSAGWPTPGCRLAGCLVAGNASRTAATAGGEQLF